MSKYKIHQNHNYRNNSKEYYINIFRQIYNFNSSEVCSYRYIDIKKTTGIKDYKTIKTILMNFLDVKWFIKNGITYFDLPPLK